MIRWDPPPAVVSSNRGPVIGVVVEVPDSVNAPRIRSGFDRNLIPVYVSDARDRAIRLGQRNEPCFHLLKKSVND